MNMGIFSVKDTSVGAFMRPFTCRGTGEAVRVFTEEVNREDRQSMVFLYPKDFELWYLGVFDDTTGHIVQRSEDVQCVCVGVDVRAA